MATLKFLDFREAITEKFNQMSMESGEHLFVTAVDPDALYARYQEAFPGPRNLIFRKQREHECSACRSFIKHAGAVVMIKPDYTVESIWDIKIDDPDYQKVANDMSAYIKAADIDHRFIWSENVVGVRQNFEIDQETGKERRWDHFYINVPQSMRTHEFNTEVARSRGKAEVFERSLTMITKEALNAVMDLIKENNLYRGLEKKSLLEKFIDCKDRYDQIDDPEKKKLFIWRESDIVSDSVSHIKNDVIGTLLVDLSNGEDLVKSVNSYESKTAPENYRRPKPVFSQRMLDDAKKKIDELGYMGSLQRRFATIDDLTINEMMFVNRDAQPTQVAATGSEALFDSMEKTLTINPDKFRSAPSIPIHDFLKDVLPDATSVELFFHPNLTKNMVSLIGPVNPDAKSMFQWSNAFSWAYTGNMTDSSLKQNVKAAGGDVTGDLRFSIQWNDQPGEWDRNDLDAHCVYPHWRLSQNQSRLYFQCKNDPYTGGALDIDIIDPEQGRVAVENITFPNRGKLRPGVYEFMVHCFTNRGGRGGFRAEIEFDGQIFSYDYQTPLRNREFVRVARVTLHPDGRFTIEHDIKSKIGSGREVWGITTNQFVPVVAIMDSPNYWATRGLITFEQNPDGPYDPNFKPPIDGPRGARHLFFMLKDCINPEEPNPFFNEFLNSDLSEFKRVMEALGAKAHVASTDDQLSGVGFAYTQHDTVIVKINGDKVYNVKM